MVEEALTQHAEAAAVILRGGPEYRRPGDPFTWAAWIARDGVDSGYVLGMIGSPAISELRRAREELRALGFRRLQFTRVSGREGEIAV
jgi:hypothetical protein